MDNILMNSENSKTSKPHVLLSYQILVFITRGKT